MDKIEVIKLENAFGETIEHVIIDKGNGEFISMHKSTYDEQQAQRVEHLTEIIPADEAKTK